MLAFGADAIPGAEADVLEVDREPWAGGGPRVLSLWLDDRARALELARATPSFAFAAEPAVVVAPPRLTMEPIVLPTPFPVGPVNCWLLQGDPLTLVDAGPNTPEALARSRRGSRRTASGSRTSSCSILTHQHSDHVGLAATIRARSGCRVAGHELLARLRRQTSRRR